MTEQGSSDTGEQESSDEAAGQEELEEEQEEEEEEEEHGPATVTIGGLVGIATSFFVIKYLCSWYFETSEMTAYTIAGGIAGLNLVLLFAASALQAANSKEEQ